MWSLIRNTHTNRPLARKQWNVNESLIECDITDGCSGCSPNCILLYGEAASLGLLGVLLLIFYFGENPEISETSMVFVSHAEFEPFAIYRVFCAQAKE